MAPNYRNFIAVRQQKRLLVNFLSSYFMSLAAKKFQDDEFLFITAGDFDGEDKDKAFLVSGGCTRDYDLACGNHEEADTRVWLHASVSSADPSHNLQS